MSGFPSTGLTPNVTTYTVGANTWLWTGTYWRKVSFLVYPDDFIINTNGELVLVYSDNTEKNLGSINGTSVTDAYVNTNGHLIIILSDGSQIDAGLVGGGGTGTPGAPGTPGVGLSDAYVNTNGQLILVYTNGTIDNVGNVVGSDGTPGAPGTPGVSVTDAYLNTNNELIIVYGGVPDNVGNVRGPTGATGLTGTSGVGLSDAYVNTNGQLILIYTNGFVDNLGVVIGPAGANGTPGAAGDSVTDAYINTNGQLIIVYGGTPDNVGNVVGSDGAPGPAGVSVVDAYVDTNSQLILVLSDATQINAGVISSVGGTGTPGGVNEQIQFNDGGIFQGDSGLTYDKTNDYLYLGAGGGVVPIFIIRNRGIIQFRELDNNQFISLRAPQSISIDSYELTLPADKPAAGEFLKVTSINESESPDQVVLEWSPAPTVSAIGGEGAIQYSDADGNFDGDSTFSVTIQRSVPRSTELFVGTDSYTGFVSLHNRGYVKLLETQPGTNYAAFRAAASMSEDTIYTLPAATGTPNQVLAIDSVNTNDETVLKWYTVPSGSGTPGGSNTYVQFNNDGSFAGDAGLRYDKNNDALTITGSLRLEEDSSNGTNYLALQANGNMASNVTLTFPATTGSVSQVLSTNGSGALSWVTSGIYNSSSSVPSSAAEGDTWFDLSTGILLVYVYDGNTYQWVEL